MLTTILILAGLALLILFHESGHFLAAKAMKMKVEEFGFGFPPKILGKRIGETEYSLNWLPFGGFVRIAGEGDRLLGETEKINSLPLAERQRLFMFQPPGRRSIVILAGVIANFILGWFLFTSVFMIGTSPDLAVYSVQKGSPAEEVGIQPRDIIRNFKTAEEFIAYVNANRGRQIEIQVEREKKVLTLEVVPRLVTQPGEGAVGIIFENIPPRDFFSAVGDGFEAAWRSAYFTIAPLYQLGKNLFISGSLPADVVGPVGIFNLAQESAKNGLVNFLKLLAMLSVNLAVLNLIPFPALDGGRFAFVLAEKIKGSPMPRQVEVWVNGIGFAFLLILMLVVTIRDIAKL